MDSSRVKIERGDWCSLWERESGRVAKGDRKWNNYIFDYRLQYINIRVSARRFLLCDRCSLLFTVRIHTAGRNINIVYLK